MGNAIVDQRRVATRGWFIVGLLACAQGINQADKAVLGLAAEPIMRELGLTTAEYGIVAGSLFASFALGGLAVAFLAAPRFAPRSIIWCMLLIWSLSQLPIVLAASFSMLVACRLVLGVAEGGGTPTLLNMCHEWFPDERRGLPGAIILAGGTVGALVAAPVLTYLISAYGWRSAFIACALAGLATMAAWLWVGRDGPYSTRVPSSEPIIGESPTLGQLLVTPAVVNCLTVGLCAFWGVGFTVAWLAPFVRSLNGVSLAASGWILSIIYLTQGAVVLAVAGLSQRLFARGHTSRVARDLVTGACLLGSAILFAAVEFVEATPGRIALIALATGLPNAIFPLMGATVSAIAPPAERYRLVTIVLSSVTISAMVAPPIIGALIDLDGPHQWRWALLVTAGVTALGSILAFRGSSQLHRWT